MDAYRSQFGNIEMLPDLIDGSDEDPEESYDDSDQWEDDEVNQFKALKSDSEGSCTIERKHHVILIGLVAPFLFNQDYPIKTYSSWIKQVGLLPYESSKSHQTSGMTDVVQLEKLWASAEIFVNVLDDIFHLMKQEDGFKLRGLFSHTDLLPQVEDIDIALDIVKTNTMFVDRCKVNPAKDTRQVATAFLISLLYVHDSCIGDRNNVKEYEELCKTNEKLCEKFRMEGNKDFNQEQYEKAIANYTKGLILHSYSHVLYGNRAQAFLKSGNYKRAEYDARSAVFLKCDWTKGHYRLSDAIQKQGDIHRAHQLVHIGIFLCDNKKQDLHDLRGLKCTLDALVKTTASDEDFKDMKFKFGYLVAHMKYDATEQCAPEIRKTGRMSSTKVLPIATTATKKESALCKKPVPELVSESSDSESESQRTKPIAVVRKEDLRCDNFDLLVSREEMAKASMNEFHQEIVVEYLNVLREASNALMESRSPHACRLYHAALERYLELPTSVLNKLQEIDIVVVKYSYGISCIETCIQEELVKSIGIFEEILEMHSSIRFPLVYYGLGKSYHKQNRFKDALAPLEKGLSIVEKDIHCGVLTWPETKTVIDETKPGNLKPALLSLIKLCRSPARPNAVCIYEFCDGHFKREIYYNDPDFKGFTEVNCLEQCHLRYHPNCWRSLKDNLMRNNDKDFLGVSCLTPDCNSIIVQLLHYDVHGTVSKEFNHSAAEKLKRTGTKKKTKLEKKLEQKERKKKKRKTETDASHDPDPDAQSVESDDNEESVDGEAGILNDEESEEVLTTAAALKKPTKSYSSVVLDSTKINIENAVVFKRDDKDDDKYKSQQQRHERQHREKHKRGGKKGTTVGLDEFLADGSEGSSSLYNEYMHRLTKLQAIRDQVENSPTNFWIEGSAKPAHTLKPGVFPHVPEHLRDNFEELEARLRTCSITQTETTLAIKENVLSYMKDFLAQKGPLNINDPIMQQEVAAFPREAQEMIVASGGLQYFLLQSLHFGSIGQFVCLREHIGQAQQTVLVNSLTKNSHFDSDDSRVNSSTDSKTFSGVPILDSLDTFEPVARAVTSVTASCDIGYDSSSESSASSMSDDELSDEEELEVEQEKTFEPMDHKSNILQIPTNSESTGAPIYQKWSTLDDETSNSVKEPTYPKWSEGDPEEIDLLMTEHSLLASIKSVSDSSIHPELEVTDYSSSKSNTSGTGIGQTEGEETGKSKGKAVLATCKKFIPKLSMRSQQDVLRLLLRKALQEDVLKQKLSRTPENYEAICISINTLSDCKDQHTQVAPNQISVSAMTDPPWEDEQYQQLLVDNQNLNDRLEQQTDKHVQRQNKTTAELQDLRKKLEDAVTAKENKEKELQNIAQQKEADQKRWATDKGKLMEELKVVKADLHSTLVHKDRAQDKANEITGDMMRVKEELQTTRVKGDNLKCTLEAVEENFKQATARAQDAEVALLDLKGQMSLEKANDALAEVNKHIEGLLAWGSRDLQLLHLTDDLVKYRDALIKRKKAYESLLQTQIRNVKQGIQIPMDLPLMEIASLPQALNVHPVMRYPMMSNPVRYPSHAFFAHPVEQLNGKALNDQSKESKPALPTMPPPPPSNGYLFPGPQHGPPAIHPSPFPFPFPVAPGCLPPPLMQSGSNPNFRYFNLSAQHDGSDRPTSNGNGATPPIGQHLREPDIEATEIGTKDKYNVVPISAPAAILERVPVNQVQSHQPAAPHSSLNPSPPIQVPLTAPCNPVTAHALINQVKVPTPVPSLIEAPSSQKNSPAPAPITQITPIQHSLCNPISASAPEHPVVNTTARQPLLATPTVRQPFLPMPTHHPAVQSVPQEQQTLPTAAGKFHHLNQRHQSEAAPSHIAVGRVSSLTRLADSSSYDRPEPILPSGTVLARPSSAHLLGYRTRDVSNAPQSGRTSVAGAEDAHQPPITSFEKLLTRLQLEFPKHSRADLTTQVRNLRARRNNSLSGLNMDTIVSKISRMLAQLQTSTGGARSVFATGQSFSEVGSSNKVRAAGGGMGLDRIAEPGVAWRQVQQESRQWSNENYEEGDPCIICHEELASDETLTLHCQHRFHKDCIKKWFRQQNTCPTCRVHSLLPDEFPSLG